MEGGARAVIGRRQKSPAVLLDDGPADRQAHTQAAGLRRVERLKQPRRVPRVDAASRVLHRDTDAIAWGDRRSDPGLAAAPGNPAPAPPTVPHPVEDDLLPLHPVAGPTRQPAGRIRSSWRPR